MGKRKIRNYLLSKDLQLRITLKFVVPALFLSVLSGLVVFLIVWPLLSEFAPDNLIKQFQTIMVIGLFLCSIGIICLVTALGIVVTHRVAGPIYRIEQDLKRLLQGEKIEPIHIRRRDEFQELVDIINQVIEMLGLLMNHREGFLIGLQLALPQPLGITQYHTKRCAQFVRNISSHLAAGCARRKTSNRPWKWVSTGWSSAHSPWTGLARCSTSWAILARSALCWGWILKRARWPPMAGGN